MILYSHEQSISTYRISNLESQSNLNSTPQFSQTNQTESCTNQSATSGATPQQTHCQLTHPPTSHVAVPLFLERPARSQTWRRPSKFAKSPFVLSSPLHENLVLLQCPLHAPQSPSLSHSPTGLHGWGFWSKLPWDRRAGLRTATTRFTNAVHEFSFFLYCCLYSASSFDFRVAFRCNISGLFTG